MTSNDDFLDVIRNSFKDYLYAGSSRSTKKLKPLHGQIAKDLSEAYGPSYIIKSQGYGEGKEERVYGRYYDKMVDITIEEDEEDINCPIAGYGVKFIMRNYSQNSNNYFESMLGETANLRTGSIPYFQIFIIFDSVPHFKLGNIIDHFEHISAHQLDKYLDLSNDDPLTYYHVPDKTLICVVKLKQDKPDFEFKTFEDYANYYKKIINDEDLLEYSKINDSFGDSVIINNYEDFIKRSKYLVFGSKKDK